MSKEKFNGPKVLYIDIETAPILARAWGIWEQNIPLNMIESDWHLLSWSAKWAHESPEDVMYMDQRKAKNIEDDYKLLVGIWRLLDEADVVVGQNSKAFDIKKLNARFVLNGLTPPSSYRQIDTMRLAKKYFGFTSFKLEYMTDKLCTKYKKLKHEKYSGYELWRAVLAGDMNAWKEMEIYNKWDVLSLEELHSVLAPWDTSSDANYAVYNSDVGHTCSCGNKEFQRNGYKYTAVGKFQRYKCNNCSKEYRDNKNMLTKDKREATLR